MSRVTRLLAAPALVAGLTLSMLSPAVSAPATPDSQRSDSQRSVSQGFGTESSAARARKSSGTVMRVATANIYGGLSAGQASSDLAKATRRADVVGLNEIHSKRGKQIRSWVARHRGWTLYRPDASQSRWAGMNAVLVRDSMFEVKDAGYTYGAESRTPHFKISDRWITWVELEHRLTGATVFHLQIHLDPAVSRGGKPLGGAMFRVRGNAEHLHRLNALVQAFSARGEVVVGGDWNIDARGDQRVGYGLFPHAILEQGGNLRSTYSELGFNVPRTSPGGYLDAIRFYKRPLTTQQVMTLTGHRVYTDVRSDHNAVVATFRINPRRIAFSPAQRG